MLILLGFVLPFAACAAMGILCARMMRKGGCHTAGLSPDQTADLARLRAEVTERQAGGRF